MAFLSKVGNIMRQTVGKQFNSELGFIPSIYQSIRCMSSSPSSKLFIGGLSFNTDEPSLRQEFAKYGEIVDARIIQDRETGRSRGFGFVTFTNVEEASSAIQALDGKELHGRLVRVNYAIDRPRTFGGGYNNAQYGGGGGFGGGYGNSPYGGAGGDSGFSGGYGNSPYGGTGGDSGFSGGYGNAPHGGAGGGSYGDGGAYGSGAGGGYGGGYNSGSNYGGPATGGSYGGSGGGDYGNNDSLGGAGGSDNLGNDFGGSSNFENDRSTSVGYDASRADAGNNLATGDDADLEGIYVREANEKGDFANRA